MTLFASGDSITSAELVPYTRRALRLDKAVRDPIPHPMLILDEVGERADQFDILHLHILPAFSDIPTDAARAITTLHGRQEMRLISQKPSRRC